MAFRNLAQFNGTPRRAFPTGRSSEDHDPWTPFASNPCRRRARGGSSSRFPWELYRGDPNWIPPLRLDEEELVGYRPHPFYERNKCQTFLAFATARSAGRIAAILNQGHNEYHNERRGFFGFFECVDDQEVAAGLFDAVRQWFAEQGIHRFAGRRTRR